jgi:hypothetical protein
MRFRLDRPSPALVVSVIALFVSLGGVSYGVATGSIDSREIRNNTVRGKDVRNSTLLSRDIRNSTLLARDFKAGQLPAGPRGATGAAGPPGRNATNLFGYIRDAGTGVVHYGSGVTAVSDPVGHGTYTVTFNRSLVNCVVQAVAGVGDPAGTSLSVYAFPQVVVAAGLANQVGVTFRNPADMTIDTSFLITAFC